MSLLHFPNLHVWTNAAFDAGTDDLDQRKENRSPAAGVNSPAQPIKNPIGELCKKGAVDGDLDIDTEIERIEREIGRLRARLEALRIKKAERESRAAATSARRGRVVPAKFLERSVKKVEESPGSRRRGVSLGPVEILKMDLAREKDKELSLTATPKPWPSIAKGTTAMMTPIGSKKVMESPSGTGDLGLRRRGLSLGPSEIFSNTQPRRNSKLQEIIEEGTVKKEKDRSSSNSPRPRRSAAAKVTDFRKGVATVGAKKPVKRDDSTLESLKPKKLFQDSKSSLPGKRPLKNVKARVVASRYSLACTRGAREELGNKRRKWSLPEDGERDATVTEKKKSASLDKSQIGVMKLEIPSNVADEAVRLMPVNLSPPSIMKIGELLPKIRTIRCTAESPRDSGCAKRVADLVGKSHFGTAADGDGLNSSGQILSFEDE